MRQTLPSRRARKRASILRAVVVAERSSASRARRHEPKWQMTWLVSSIGTLGGAPALTTAATGRVSQRRFGLRDGTRRSRTVAAAPSHG